MTTKVFESVLLRSASSRTNDSEFDWCWRRRGPGGGGGGCAGNDSNASSCRLRSEMLKLRKLWKRSICSGTLAAIDDWQAMTQLER